MHHFDTKFYNFINNFQNQGGFLKNNGGIEDCNKTQKKQKINYLSKLNILKKKLENKYLLNFFRTLIYPSHLIQVRSDFAIKDSIEKKIH